MKTKHTNTGNGTNSSRGRGRPKKDTGESVSKYFLNIEIILLIPITNV